MNPTIVVLGANGFLGRYLTRYFALQGKEVVAIARSREGWSGDGMFLEWDGKTRGPWALALEGAEAVINLAGRSVNCRYTAKHREEILNSRVDSTRAIGEAIRACAVPPKVWLNSSTATWYRHAEDRAQDEWLGEPGTGFSYSVAQAWEDAFFGDITPAVTRKVALRSSMVLANEPGTVYAVLRKLAACGLAGTMGSGSQRASWMHMEDFLRAVEFVIEDTTLDGVVNLSAPEFPTNRELMKLVSDTVMMPVQLPAPRWLLETGAFFLRTETELVLKSRWALPLRLNDADFRWHWADPAAAIVDLVDRRGLSGFFKFSGSRSIGARAWLPMTNH